MADTQNSIAVRDHHAVMEAVITKGDLSKLTAEEKWQYYSETCRSIGLNPLTKPFDYLTLSGKTVLYATKACTDQLRSLRGISVTKVDARTEGDMRIVEVYATDSTGRQDMDMGVTTVKGLSGDALANAYMKALTKAKRRVTLSLCGLGMLDESEIETIPGAQLGIAVEHQATPARLTDSTTPAATTPAATGKPTRPQVMLLADLAKRLDLSNADVRTQLLDGKASAACTAAEVGAAIATARDMIDRLEETDAGFGDDVEVDPDTGEVTPDWVGKIAEADQFAGMPTPMRGRTADQIAGMN